MTWIERSGQRWKAIVFLGLIGLDGAALLVSTLGYRGKIAGDYKEYFSLATALITAVALLWLGSAVRCSTCGLRVGWWYMRNASMAEWFSGLWKTERCPSCGACH
jgi:uncharacterized membrane protein YeaQ/YmgE (transglycosylase-associated protein family)